jgi:hypothetical protein
MLPFLVNSRHASIRFAPSLERARPNRSRTFHHLSPTSGGSCRRVSTRPNQSLPPLPRAKNHRSQVTNRLCLNLTSFFCGPCGLFRTMDARNPFSFNRFRTLSIAMGVYTPPLYFLPFAEGAPPRAQNRRANCTLLRNNSLPCHTCTFDGGEGGSVGGIERRGSRVGSPTLWLSSVFPAGDVGREHQAREK